MTFQHPVNGYQKRIDSPGAFTLIAGPIFFALHGIWLHAVLSAGLAVLTAGVSWLVYPLASEGIVRNAYLSRGWTEVAEPPRERIATAPLFSAKTRRDVFIVAALLGAFVLAMFGIDAYLHPDAYLHFYGLR